MTRTELIARLHEESKFDIHHETKEALKLAADMLEADGNEITKLRAILHDAKAKTQPIDWSPGVPPLWPQPTKGVTIAVLEDDGDRQAGDELTIKCYQAQVDDLTAAARLALDALLKKNGKWGQGHDELEARAITALTEALE